MNIDPLEPAPLPDWTNTNGLVDGCVPAGKPCPFFRECKGIAPNCPTDSHLLSGPFSCAFARLISMNKLRPNKIFRDIIERPF